MLNLASAGGGAGAVPRRVAGALPPRLRALRRPHDRGILLQVRTIVDTSSSAATGILEAGRLKVLGNLGLHARLLVVLSLSCMN